MIAVYAQSLVREGLDVALNGHKVAEDDPRFVDLRSISMRLALRADSATSGVVRRWIGHGIVRFQLDGQDPDDDSPVVIVIPFAAFDRDFTDVVEQVTRSIYCIERSVDRDTLAKFVLAARSELRRRKTRLKAVSALAVAGVAGAVLFVRMRARSSTDKARISGLRR